MYADLVGKYVQVNFHDETSLDGRLEAKNPAALLLRTHNSRCFKMINTSTVESVIEKERPAVPITEKNAQDHLLDRHGYYLSWAKITSPQDALKHHQDLDHSDINHSHD